MHEGNDVDVREVIPDVRDGLTHTERVVLVCLQELQKEMGGRNVSSIMLYGRVVERLDMSMDEMQSLLQKLM